MHYLQIIIDDNVVMCHLQLWRRILENLQYGSCNNSREKDLQTVGVCKNCGDPGGQLPHSFHIRLLGDDRRHIIMQGVSAHQINLHFLDEFIIMKSHAQVEITLTHLL